MIIRQITTKFCEPACMKITFYGILLVFFAIAVFMLYNWRLDETGFAFWPDEAAIGFEAYNIAVSLKDSNGQSMPLYFNYHNDFIFRPPVFIYASAIVTKFLGLSIYTTKLTGILFAVMASIMLFLVTRYAFNLTAAIFATLFMVLSPGYFHIHRMAFELTSFNTFFLGYILFTMLAIKKNKYIFSFPAFLCFVLAWYSYVPSRIFMVSFVFLACITLIPVVIQKFNTCKDLILSKKSGLLMILFALLVFIPEALMLNKFSNASYTKHALIFNKDMFHINNLIYERLPVIDLLIIDLPLFIKKMLLMFYNYYTCYMPSFLFFEGDGHILNLIPGYGFLSVAGVILIPAGIAFSIIKFKDIHYRLLFIALLCAGIPSTLMWVLPDGTHNSYMYSVFSILSGCGAYFIISLFSKINHNAIKASLVSIITLIILFSMAKPFITYYKSYHSDYKNNYSHVLNTNRDQIACYILENHHKYKKVLVSNQIWMAKDYLLYFFSSENAINLNDYQKTKKLPFNVEMIRNSLYADNIERESIKDFFGTNILMIVSESELAQYQPSAKALRNINGNIFSYIMEF